MPIAGATVGSSARPRSWFLATTEFDMERVRVEAFACKHFVWRLRRDKSPEAPAEAYERPVAALACGAMPGMSHARTSELSGEVHEQNIVDRQRAPAN